MLHIPSARDPRRDERRRERDDAAVLQFQVARREEVAFLEDQGARRAAGGGGGVGSQLASSAAGMDVDVGSLGTVVEARVGQGGERGHADADEAGGDFRLAPEEDLGLVPG